MKKVVDWKTNHIKNRLSLRSRFLVLFSNAIGENSLEILYEKTKTLGWEFFCIILGQSLAILGAVVGVRLMTNVLPPASYGELALGMTVAMLTHQILWGPLGQAFLRFFAPAQESNKLGIYIKAIRQLITRASFIFIVISGFVLFGLWAFGYAKWLGLIGAAFLFSLISGCNANLDGIQNAARQRLIVAWHQASGSWLRFLVAVGLIYLLGSFSMVAMLGYGLAALMVFGSQIWFFNRRILTLKPSPYTIGHDDVRKWTKQMVGYSWPFATWGILTWAQTASDRWALQLLGATSDVGLYAVLYQLGFYPIMMLSGLFTQLVVPVLFAWAGDCRDEVRVQKTRHFTYLLILVALLSTAVAAVLALLFHHQIFFWLTAPKYREVSSFLPLMVIAGGLFSAGQLAALSIMTSIKTQVLIAPKIFTALLGIMLNFAGAYFMGIRGVVWACIAFSLFYFLWMIYLNKPKVLTA